jgi:hypothetical protein
MLLVSCAEEPLTEIEKLNLEEDARLEQIARKAFEDHKKADNLELYFPLDGMLVRDLDSNIYKCIANYPEIDTPEALNAREDTYKIEKLDHKTLEKLGTTIIDLGR